MNTRKNAQKIHTEMCHLQGGPHVRANGVTKANAPRDLDMGPHIRLPEEDKDERRPGGAGRPPGSAEPGRPPVQVHFEEESAPSLLITFHTCIWREPTSTSINSAPSHPSLSLTHTHTSFHSLQEGSPLSCSLS